jgi:hypothetical protein
MPSEENNEKVPLEKRATTLEAINESPLEATAEDWNRVRPIVLNLAKHLTEHHAGELVKEYLTPLDERVRLETSSDAQVVDELYESMVNRSQLSIGRGLVTNHTDNVVRTATRLALTALVSQEALDAERDYRNALIGTYFKLHKLGVFSLSDEQRRKISSSVGIDTRDREVGIFGLTVEERRRLTDHFTEEDYRRNGELYGPRGGRRSRELGVGIHGLTTEERREIGKVAGISGGKASAVARGLTPYSAREDALILELAKIPSSKYSTGQYAGKYNVKIIAAAVEAELGITRKPRDYSRRLAKLLKPKDYKI